MSGRIQRITAPGQAGKPGAGSGERKTRTTINVAYPQMRITASDRSRLLAIGEVKRNGWDAAKVDLLLEKARTTIESMRTALGHYPELEFVLKGRDEDSPQNAMLVFPLEKKVAIILGNERDSDFLLTNVERLLCEHLAQFFLCHSPAAVVRLQNPAAFINGITDNPYLDGLQMGTGQELVRLILEIVTQEGEEVGVRHEGEQFKIRLGEGAASALLKAVASVAPEYVRAKVTKTLCPHLAVSRDPYENRARREVASILEAIRRESVDKRASIDGALIVLAHEAARVEIWGFRDISEGIEDRIRKEIVPAEAESQLAEILLEEGAIALAVEHYTQIKDAAAIDLSPKTLRFFYAVKNCYLQFFNGVRIKRSAG